MITLSTLEFTANAVTTVTATVPADARFSHLYSDDSRLKLSLDNSVWSADVDLETGDNTVYIRVGDMSGEYKSALGYYTYQSETADEGYYTISVTGGTVPSFTQVSFSLSPRQATTQFSGTAVNSSFTLGSNNTYRVLDYNCNYYIDSINEQGAQAVISGAAFSEALVHKLIIYSVDYEFDALLLGWRRPTVQDHFTAISREIGIPIVYRGRTFYPKTDMNIMLRKHITHLSEQISGSFGDIINRLVGWSDTVPGMTYNVYVENGTIYVVQQGYEQSTVVTDNAWALRPTLAHTIRRTQWADSQYQTVVPKEISSSDAANSNQPYSGTLVWGDTSLTYTDGYLTQEVKGNVTTTYTYNDYDDGKRLATKTITEKDEIDPEVTVSETVSTYTYQTTETNVYLFEELTTTTEDGEITLKQLTRHVPMGGGWYGTTVYDVIDGSETVISNNISQGAPGNVVSQYMIDAQNDALKPAGSQRQMVVELNGVAKARQTYPVADYDTLLAIATALNSFEGKEQVQLSGEIVGGSHIYTYNDKISFNGNEYYIVSNNVTQTYNTIRQSITAMRWLQ